jgi:hypothetical protein
MTEIAAEFVRAKADRCVEALPMVCIKSGGGSLS